MCPRGEAINYEDQPGSDAVPTTEAMAFGNFLKYSLFGFLTATINFKKCEQYNLHMTVLNVMQNQLCFFPDDLKMEGDDMKKEGEMMKEGEMLTEGDAIIEGPMVEYHEEEGEVHCPNNQVNNCYCVFCYFLFTWCETSGYEPGDFNIFALVIIPGIS